MNRSIHPKHGSAAGALSQRARGFYSTQMDEMRMNILTRRQVLVAGCAAVAIRFAGCSGSQAAAPVETGRMVKIPSGEFWMGVVEGDTHARPDESPRHRVAVEAFEMDETEVTNAQFRKFVEATKYVTTAERKPDWEELKKQLPEGTPKPPDDVLVAGSIVFSPPDRPVALDNAAMWWAFVAGADWRHPLGPESSIDGKDDHPVVQVSWDDAIAYAKWAGKRLPTEAEWEWASRGGLADKIYAWGEEDVDEGTAKANTFEGQFPNRDEGRDGFKGIAPVKKYKPNGYGLYDTSGNVWEWCSDWYRHDYYAQCAKTELSKNPQGPGDSFDPEEPSVPKRVQRGGSFLCHDSYCASYRASARMKTSPDTGLSHSGFRCVR
jgi:sulfatase modifying factor 1